MLRRAEISNFNHLFVKKITASYTVQPSDEVILVDATSAAVTITLPDAVGNANQTLYIKKTDGSGNAVTVSGVNSQTIDGNSSVSLSSQYATLTVTSDGANWIEKTVAGASTFTGGTITGATTVSLASANAFVVGPNGTTNPTLQVDTSTASAATGIKVTSAAAGSGILIQAISSGTNEPLTLKAKGSSNVSLGVGADNSRAFQLLNAAGTAYLRTDSQFSRVRIGDGNAAGHTLDIAGIVNVACATATPAGGSATAGLIFGTSTGFGIYYGSGVPTLSAGQGSIYLRSDGTSTSTRLYVNTDGATTWTNLTSAA